MSDTTTDRMSNDELQDMLITLFGKLPEPDLTRDNTALLCIDVQYVDAHPDYGLGARAKALGLGDKLNYFWSRIDEMVLPNMQRVMGAARKMGVEVIHVRVASQTADGRDSTLRYKALGLKTPRDTKEAQFLPEVAPGGIKNLIIMGVVTNGCVESSTRSAAELDYGTIVVEDATAAMAPQLHEHSIISMSYKDAYIMSSDEVVKKLEALA